jgi:tRNA (guanine37-N1)-methyltransferase
MRAIDFVTLFPEWIESALSHSIMGRASANGHVQFRTANPRNYCYDPHKKVDDTPYGGHPGMLLKAEPLATAIDSLTIENANRAIVITEPSGISFVQDHAAELAKYEQITFVCGHYEGIDHRIEETYATHVFSIGDYVLTNGELPALVMADAVVRLLPGVLGNQTSLANESFHNNLLAAPNYTRPEVWRGVSIPDVLKSGHHKEIAKWERDQSVKRTKERRPDLILDKNVPE